MSIRLFYGMWPQYDRRLREVVGAMTDEQLAIRPSPDGWPIWATVGHTAGGRVYWLCTILGEAGADETPFAGGVDGWEDDLDHPRSAAELVLALETTFRIIDRCLDRWTPAMLEERVERAYGQPPGPHPRLDPAAPPQPRCLPLRRAVADAGHRRLAPDRPVAPRLSGLFCGASPSTSNERCPTQPGGSGVEHQRDCGARRPTASSYTRSP